MVEDCLAHHGILGQKWGVRRYQNTDGTLTDLGKKRYAKSISKYTDRKEAEKEIESHLGAIRNKSALKQTGDDYKQKSKAMFDYENSKEYINYRKNMRNKAYSQVYKWYEENDPDSLKEMIKANGGKKTGLDAFHDFDTIMDGSLDYMYDQHPNPKMDKLYNDWSDSLAAYQKECDAATKDIVGRYGNMKLKNIPQNASGYYEIRDLVGNVLDDKYTK